MSAASRTVLGFAPGPEAGVPPRPPGPGAVTPSPPVPGCPPAGCAACAMRTSFPASRDGPLKDASSVTRYQPGGGSSLTAAPAPAAGVPGCSGEGPASRPRVTVCDIVPPPPARNAPPRRLPGVSAGPAGRNPDAVSVVDL